ncbi:exosortase A [Oleiagrimonas sp.]|jgi:exosortase A|uniref:exosortase A n=1 Tax=Oleiagrimonas sp. TaxID=2010330 RepID=UPI00262BDC6D|nr:exosortase A [Oleiagrimonas sp.]MDA3913508.1 EpsI family protein [Oleiagrimonas sp.]
MNRAIGARSTIFTRVSDWRVAVAALALAIIVLLTCYWQTALSLVWVWDHDGTYQYAFLIYPLSLWLAFNLRHQVQANSPVPSVWGLAVVAVLVFVWYAGHLLDINLPQHFAFVALLPALVLAFWGWRALSVLAFPLAYLVVFAVPWGDGLVGPLQDITAHIAVHALDLTGSPALLDGRQIVTPIATWMVADACSGVKFFIACSALGCLYAYLMYQRWWKRALFVLMATVVPIIANGLRVYFTILIGETWGLKYATGTDHMIFGWQFFGTVLVLLLLAGWFFRDPPVIRELAPARGRKLAGTRGMVWLAAIVLLLAGPVLAAKLAAPVHMESMHLTAPEVPGWTQRQTGADDWTPSFKGAAGQIRASYQSAVNDDVVELFHAVYTGKPRRGHTLITYGNDVYDPAHAQLLSNASRSLHLADGQHFTAEELHLAGAAGPRLVWYWYCVDRRCTGSRVLAKLAQAWDVLRGYVPQSSVWALSSPIGQGGLAQARTKLHAFARVLPVTGTPHVKPRPAGSGHKP